MERFSGTPRSSQGDGTLRPTYSIWLLGEDLLRDDPDYAHRYRLRDDRGRALLDHGGMYLLELIEFAAERVETEQERWLAFFRDGERLDIYSTLRGCVQFET